MISPPALVRSLEVRDFRNYHNLRLTLDDGLNALVGPNGAGKTSVLEGIAYIGLARSMRRVQDGAALRGGARGFSVAGMVGDAGGAPTTRVEVSYDREHGKVLSINEHRTRASVLWGRMPVTIFTPDDLWMLKGGPGERRTFLDTVLTQAMPVYGQALGRFRRAVLQRNALLKEVRARRAPANALAVWDAQLVQYGAELQSRRGVAVSQLEVLAAEAFGRLSSGAANLRLRYAPAIGDAGREGSQESWSPEDWGRILHQAYERGRDRDLLTGSTAFGPHRDDLEVYMDDRLLSAFGSQGEQRRAVLALKCAERGYLCERLGRLPVLLLDDVLSEFDTGRRRALGEAMLREGQVFLTTADPDSMRGLPARTEFHVAGGRVTPDR